LKTSPARYKIVNYRQHMTTLYVKNMVCDRCRLVVEQVLTRLDLHADKITLGEVTLREDNLSETVLQNLDSELESVGFARIDDRKARLIEAIKAAVIDRIRHTNGADRKLNWSDLLAEALHYEYSYLSNLFSSVEGITLEQYIIRQKIERAKELLFYDELNLSEIALQLGYSSVAHLSSQFKKVTGFTPSALKKSHPGQRKPIDQVI